MTLTTAPCELDTMSLFQDLKLKRRKVDSRCSSDGEYLGNPPYRPVTRVANLEMTLPTSL